MATETTDVCIVGGGVAGVSAALQAQQAGAKTVLVERGFQVGGNLCRHFCHFGNFSGIIIREGAVNGGRY